MSTQLRQVWSFRTIAAPVGQVMAELRTFGTCQIRDVGFAAAAHSDVCPLPAGGIPDDGESAVNGDSLGLMPREGIAVADVSFVEVPVGKPPDLWVSVESNGQCPLLGIDGYNGGEISV